MIELADDDYRWAKDVARRICLRRGIEPDDDLVQEARIALAEAARAFDRGRATCGFRCYGWTRIYQRIIDEVRCRLGRPKHQKAKRAFLTRLVSLETPTARGDETLGETLAGPDGDPEVAAMDREAVAEILARLSPQERQVAIRLARGMRQMDIAREFGVSRPRIWQLAFRIRRKLAPARRTTAACESVRTA